MSDIDEPKLTVLGKLVVGLFVAGCLFGAYHFFLRTGPRPTPPDALDTAAGVATTGGKPVVPPGETVEIGIAYGTEKKSWLEAAVRGFNDTPQGRAITINLIPKGSVEGAQAVWRDENKSINVWSPASSLYKDVFVEEWQAKHGSSPILKEETLALTPMVFVFWEKREEAFRKKLGEISFTTIGVVLDPNSSWKTIADQPDWGVFKFGHTNPARSNSGLLTLVLMAYCKANKSRGLTTGDVTDPLFLEWMRKLESGVSGLADSTGTLMKDMVQRGPSTFDAIFVYESVAIDFLKAAESRWDKLRIVYPHYNMWSDNPYYILDVPWSSPAQRKAAETFLEFLMSEPVQKAALTHGFRPGNVNVPVKNIADSPFAMKVCQDAGLKLDVTSSCEPPKAEVLTNLLLSWQRSAGSR